jgi:hypothetical protein
MAYVLKLEAIGNDVICTPADRVLRRLFGAKMPRRWWVAEIALIEGRYTRTFVKGRKDYSASNSTGTRGVNEHYILFPGRIYEISAPESWKRIDRYFARVEEKTLIRMTDEEVRAWINARSTAPSM